MCPRATAAALRTIACWSLMRSVMVATAALSPLATSCTKMRTTAVRTSSSSSHDKPVIAVMTPTSCGSETLARAPTAARRTGQSLSCSRMVSNSTAASRRVLPATCVSASTAAHLTGHARSSKCFAIFLKASASPGPATWAKVLTASLLTSGSGSSRPLAAAARASSTVMPRPSFSAAVTRRQIAAKRTLVSSLFRRLVQSASNRGLHWSRQDLLLARNRRRTESSPIMSRHVSSTKPSAKENIIAPGDAGPQVARGG
mmetsp:Transcript_112882/g.364371  ORF Transcript_112882/g.364371 Transcript_112882/m.364371 type:complete len:258 (-) Transcript_112882:41-814(-)